jgi:hypothetical protein
MQNIDLTHELCPDISLLSVDVESILNGLSMQISNADNYLLTLIDNLLYESQKNIKPKAAFTIIENPKFDFENKKLFLNEIDFNIGKVVFSFVKKSEHIVVFACTIGDKLEKHSKKLMQQNESLEGYIVDIIGSEYAEACASYLHKYIETFFQDKGLNLSNRFSPGYCNWPVSEQQNLFAVLGEKNCGIAITDSSLMLPVKSVSGIIGLGKTIKRVDYKCNICDDKKCILRKKKN